MEVTAMAEEVSALDSRLLQELEDQIRTGRLSEQQIRDFLDHKNPFPVAAPFFFEGIDDSRKNLHVPKGWSVEDHRRVNLAKGDLVEVGLYLDPRQLGKPLVKGHLLRKVFQGSRKAMNAVFLEHYLARPETIPAEWVGKQIYFWNTIYRNEEGVLLVRYLCCQNGHWYSHYSWLSQVWGEHSPAAEFC